MPTMKQQPELRPTRLVQIGNEAIRDQWGEEGLIAIGYCISSCRVFPALKYTLGYGKACIRVKVNEQSVAPNRQAPLVMERNSV